MKFAVMSTGWDTRCVTGATDADEKPERIAPQTQHIGVSQFSAPPIVGVGYVHYGSVTCWANTCKAGK